MRRVIVVVARWLWLLVLVISIRAGAVTVPGVATASFLGRCRGLVGGAAARRQGVVGVRAVGLASRSRLAGVSARGTAVPAHAQAVTR